MKLVFDSDNIRLYCGDFRDAAEVVDAAWADVTMADPPYGETSLAWDRWPDGWPTFARALTKRNGAMWCFGSMRMFIEEWPEFAAWKMSHEVVWEKHNGSGFLNDRFRRVHEFAVHFSQRGTEWADVYKSTQFTFDARKRVVRKKEKPAQWHGKTGSTTYVSEDGGPRLMRSVLRVRSCHGHALNETQKPLGIIHPLLNYACPKNGRVLVPFAGSGSELLAAKELGLQAIGFELRAEQCEIAVDRLAQGIIPFGTAEPMERQAVRSRNAKEHKSSLIPSSESSP